MVKMFYENGMTVDDLKVLVDRAIAAGYGKAHVQVQADADHISDIMINGYEGFGDEFGNSECPIFSIVSAENEKMYNEAYGPSVRGE